MLPIIVSLTPLFAWGISDYTASRLSAKENPGAINLSFSLGSIVTALILMAYFGVPEFTVPIVLRHLASVIIVNLAFLVFLKAFSYGFVGIVAVISNAYALVTVLGSALFLGVSINERQWVAMTAVLFGIGLLSYVRNPKSHPDSHKLLMSILLSLLAMVGFGLGFMMFDIAATQEWHANFIVMQSMNLLVGPLILLYFTGWKKAEAIKAMKSVARHKVIYIGAVIASLGTIGLYGGIELTGNAAIPTVFAAGGPLVTALLAYYFDKERMSLRKWAGAIVVVAGIIALRV